MKRLKQRHRKSHLELQMWYLTWKFSLLLVVGSVYSEICPSLACACLSTYSVNTWFRLPSELECLTEWNVAMPLVHCVNSCWEGQTYLEWKHPVDAPQRKISSCHLHIVSTCGKPADIQGRKQLCLINRCCYYSRLTGMVGLYLVCVGVIDICLLFVASVVFHFSAPFFSGQGYLVNCL